MKKIIPSLSKMWLKVINLEQSLFPRMETVVGTLSPKEEKLMKVLDSATAGEYAKYRGDVISYSNTM